MKLYCDPPRLEWRDTGPVAPDFDDIYFSAEGGLDETRAVFLAGCGLPDRWQRQDNFVIGELGFGTGLNFLAAWQLWNETRPQNGWLHFISIEKFPLRLDDLRKALSAFPELAALSGQLIAQWPQPLKGAHRLRFDADRITLTLFQDDIAEALPQIEARVDAWFLDGFAPAHNGAMWSETVWPELARLSVPGARVATFTVAGAVRRGLSAAGFTVEKKPGFGRKRERLEGVFAGPAPEQWPTPYARAPCIAGPIAIIGGGIAGASLAYALRKRGRDVTILSRGGLSAGASGAPVGLLTPRLEYADRPHVRATLAAFEFARRLYDGLDGFFPEGALRLAKDEADELRLEKLSEILGEGYQWRVNRYALWMERAGRFDPAALVRALVGDTPVLDVDAPILEASSGGWGIRAQDGKVLMLAAQVIWAGGAEQGRFLTRNQIPVDDDPGRLMVFDLEGPAPAMPLVWGGYASAAPAGGLLIGATHERYRELRSNEDVEDELKSALRIHDPDLYFRSGAIRDVWGKARASTPDRLPVVGTLPDFLFSSLWAPFAKGGPGPVTMDGSHKRRLAILNGLGARGFAHAPLLAEALASDLCGEPSPLERDGREALHPARFAIRNLKRGQI